VIGPNNTRYCINQEALRCISLPLAFYFRGPHIFPRVINEQFMLFSQSKKPYFTNKNKTKLRGLSPQARTIPTERPPLVGEVNANFSG
jgi:hypothetical protein